MAKQARQATSSLSSQSHTVTHMYLHRLNSHPLHHTKKNTRDGYLECLKGARRRTKGGSSDWGGWEKMGRECLGRGLRPFIPSIQGVKMVVVARLQQRWAPLIRF